MESAPYSYFVSNPFIFLSTPFVVTELEEYRQDLSPYQ